MPEFNFFFNEQDEIELIEFVLTQLGLSIVPDMKYEGPEYKIIKDVITYRKYREIEQYGFNIGSFYFLSESFYRCPLEMHRIEGGKADGKYFIMPENGGPAIDIHFAPVYIEGNERVVAPGDVSHYPAYWDPLERHEKVPEELKKTYQEIVKFIKRDSFPCTPVLARRKIWVRKHAAEEFFAGKLKLQWYDTNYIPIQKK